MCTYFEVFDSNNSSSTLGLLRIYYFVRRGELLLGYTTNEKLGLDAQTPLASLRLPNALVISTTHANNGRERIRLRIPRHL